MMRHVARLVRAVNDLPVWRIPVRVDGHRLDPPSFDRLLSLILLKLSVMGSGDRAFFRQRLRPGMTVVDVGANQGIYTLLFAELVGSSGHVLAFEPDPVLCSALRQNLRRNGTSNVTVYENALGARSEQRLLLRSAVNSGDNRLTIEAPSQEREGVIVATRPLDELTHGRKVDFVKIDVQGWELEVLQGMVETLRSSSPMVFFEYSPADLRAAGAAPSDVWTFFGKHGFEIHEPTVEGLKKLGGPDTVTLSRPFAYANLVAMREGASG
jgi:FkbM family methyltransferase